MGETSSRAGLILARLAVVLSIGLIVLGAIWYGFSADVFRRISRDIAERPGGPMTFRFFLQPAMAGFAAIRDGMKDARLGHSSPYFWAALHDGEEFARRLREAAISTARIFLLGLGMDAVYQYRVLKAFYPGEAVLVASLLAVLPYLLLRGPAAWMTRRRSGRSASVEPHRSGQWR